MPLFLFIFIFLTYIHSFILSHSYNTFIHRPFAQAFLYFLIACLLSGEKPPCGAEPRVELGPALQQADALPTEPRRTIVNLTSADLSSFEAILRKSIYTLYIYYIYIYRVRTIN